MSDDEKHNEWLKKRNRTFISFCIVCFGLGFEYSLIFPSLWFYMKDIIKADKPQLFYGLAISAYPASSIVGAFTIASYADKTKKTRHAILLLLTCEIIGNGLYSVYFSEWFPVIGRFIAGFGDVANMVVIGEVSRSYESDEITSKISWMVMCFSVGFTISPGMNILFKSTDFHIGPLHMGSGNMPGFFMALCFILIIILSFFMVSDISREFDLKATNEQMSSRDIKGIDCKQHDLMLNRDGEDEDEPYQENHHKRGNHTRRMSTLRMILSTFDLVLLLVFGFICSYTLFGFDVLMSLIGSKYFGFNVSQTSLIFIIDGLIYGFVLFAIGKASKRFSDFNIIVCAVLVQLFGQAAILTLSLYHSNIYINYICFIFYILAFSTTWSIEEVLSRSLFGKLVPSYCQSYAEGVRRSVSNVAFIISGISTAGLFAYLPIMFSVLIFLTLIMFAVFLYRRESLSSPVPQFQLESNKESEYLLG